MEPVLSNSTIQSSTENYLCSFDAKSNILTCSPIDKSDHQTKNHSWNGYHWYHTSNPVTITLGDNVSSVWDPFLRIAASQWSLTSGPCNNLTNPIRCIVANGLTNPRTCKSITGTVQVCNANYGATGWLGIAYIWVRGNVIYKGSVKLNDYYHRGYPYNSSVWRQFVMSQEIGHVLGLNHQDEIFNNGDLVDVCNRGSCMDYSSDPTNNISPNQHDYDELVSIYSQLDSPQMVSTASNNMSEQINIHDQKSWGNPLKCSNGNPVIFQLDLNRGDKIITRVIWKK